jgi:hypothetical protein
MSTQEQSYKILDGYTLNAGNNFSVTSAPIKLNAASIICVNAFLTGATPSGTLKLQGTNELDDQTVRGFAPGINGSGGTAWIDIPTATASISAIGAGGRINISYLGDRYVRVVYTGISGTGAISVWVSVKN